MADAADNADAESAGLLDYGLAAHARRRAGQAAAPVNWRGLCHDCDEPIDPRRLAADPHVARCLLCQHDAERRAAHRRRR